MTLSDKVLVLGEWLAQRGLDLHEFSYEYNTFRFKVFNASELSPKERINIKRAFGKLHAEGTPPYVRLESTPMELPGTLDTKVELVVYGAYECNIASTRTETIVVPAVEAAPERIETVEKHTWTCTANLSAEDF